ncbi:hypothetical protein G8A07_12295 [Roseateles sp. DAIF2]|uniref:hypothetical protein n=1 Tax=Roseateles sp. DAIF2 TaxID=2714952 RepID=UPI0018A27D73|nr:hypothetical protein [Roseateles sp. DAIF2]QPF73628.1 hypothetical protein G8A07_12295 [Roseateles sp. DAIF2]
MPPRYAEWLKYVFERPVTPNGWYFDIETLELFEADASELVELVAAAFENCARDLASYSNEQLRYGLSYIVDNGASDIVFAIMSEDVAVELRLRAIAGLKHVYSHIFETRCAPVLGHTSEPGSNALNYMCYMLWDISPLSYWERSPKRTIFYGAVCDVLERALTSPNRACVESGLHGLGHIYSSYPERVEEVIDQYLHAASPPEDLRRYAMNARRGHVQ